MRLKDSYLFVPVLTLACQAKRAIALGGGGGAFMGGYDSNMTIMAMKSLARLSLGDSPDNQDNDFMAMIITWRL